MKQRVFSSVSLHSPSAAAFGLTLYLLVFFAAPFEPYATMSEVTPSRGWFLGFLLLPDEFFATWLGPDGSVSLTDRIPILLTTCICLIAAVGAGLFLLTITGIARRLSTLETWVFSAVVGLSVFSTVIFWIGYYGGLHGAKTVWFVTGCSVLIFCGSIPSLCGAMTEEKNWSILKKVSVFVVVPIFTLFLILGGMIPSTDYDVLSYHLQGAREFFESGRIGFIPHNVYANMPFGAEMFAVWGMALTGKTLTGAMVGKTIISVTTLLTGLGVYTFGRRFFSETVGLVGMVLYLTTPWILYVSTVGLIDSVVGMYTFFALYAVCLERGAAIVDWRNKSSRSWRYVVFVGFLAGSAAACKYPAVLFVIVPIGVYYLVDAWKSKRRKTVGGTTVAPGSVLVETLLLFSLSVVLACGGWYIKNWHDTGNPVYPLCHSIFGDSTGTWTSEADARWTRVHSPPGFGPDRLLGDFWNVTMTSPWNSPLIVPLCALVFMVPLTKKRKQLLRLLAVWLLFVFVIWWFLTHRIDRFWIVTIPILCVFASVGSTFCTEKNGQRFLGALLALACVYGFLVSASPAPGKVNHYLAAIHSVHNQIPWPTWFNAHPPKGKILLVGEAKAFLFDTSIVYNSCFNETALKPIALSNDPTAELKRMDIEYILVDWGEIRRFRSPGNYGYSDVVQAELFGRWSAAGVLQRFCPQEELAGTSVIVYKTRDAIPRQ